jgi:hypothetical protein
MKLKNQLFLITLIAGALLIFVINLLRYNKIADIIIEYRVELFANNSNSKVFRIQQSIQEKLKKGKVIAEELIKEDSTCKNSQCSEKIDSILKSYLHFNFFHLAIVNNEGNTIASAGTTLYKATNDYTQFFIYGLNKKSFIKSRYMGKGQLLNTISTPLWVNNKFTGILIIEEIDSEIIITMNDYTGMGMTGET